jgi:hypothetical protein
LAQQAMERKKVLKPRTAAAGETEKAQTFLLI